MDTETQAAIARVMAQLELSDALLAAIIENHPDPVSVRAAWRDVTSQASAALLLDTAASGQSSAYREQTQASIAKWENVLAGICARSPREGI